MIGVVIVTYNSEKYLKTCLESLFSQGVSLKCFVIDNASSDHSVQLVQKSFPEVEIIERKKNEGFSKAVNVGIKKCLEEGCEEVLILNPDTKMEDSALAKMLLVMKKEEGKSEKVEERKEEKNERREEMETGNGKREKGRGIKEGMNKRREERRTRKVGIVQPLITLMSDPDRINTWGNEYKGFGLVALGGFREKIEKGKGKTKKRNHISYASGACMLVKSEVFREVGLFDERFFLYFEDTDFSSRVRKAGYEILLAADARVQHDYQVLRSFRLWGYFLSSWMKWVMKT